jgi:hypothetical protein
MAFPIHESLPFYLLILNDFEKMVIASKVKCYYLIYVNCIHESNSP